MTAATATDTTTSKGAQTRDAILRAAIERFGALGYRATSVAEIARHAGVGGTVTYAYFPNKEALFLAAIDEDAAGVIGEGTETISQATLVDWRQTLVFTLIEAVDRHPLARRLLAGLEPEVTGRVLEIPALADLRKLCGERIRAEQLEGTVRSDIDPVALGNGFVAILLSLLMSVVQIGTESTLTYGPDIAAVFRAALEPPRG